MSPVTPDYFFTHAIEIHLATVLLAFVVSFFAIKLALIVEDFAKFLRAKFANSGSGRRFAGRLETVGDFR